MPSITKGSAVFGNGGGGICLASLLEAWSLLVLAVATWLCLAAKPRLAKVMEGGDVQGTKASVRRSKKNRESICSTRQEPLARR